MFSAPASIPCKGWGLAMYILAHCRYHWILQGPTVILWGFQQQCMFQKHCTIYLKNSVGNVITDWLKRHQQIVKIGKAEAERSIHSLTLGWYNLLKGFLIPRNKDQNSIAVGFFPPEAANNNFLYGFHQLHYYFFHYFF